MLTFKFGWVSFDGGRLPIGYEGTIRKEDQKAAYDLLHYFNETRSIAGVNLITWGTFMPKFFPTEESADRLTQHLIKEWHKKMRILEVGYMRPSHTHGKCFFRKGIVVDGFDEKDRLLEDIARGLGVQEIEVRVSPLSYAREI